MVSRRNFFAITAVMLIICFLFQSLNVAKEYWNDYEVNSYAQDTSALPGKEEVYTVDAQDTSQKLLVLIGDEKENRVFSDWAFYMKWAFASYDSLSAYEKARKAIRTRVSRSAAGKSGLDKGYFQTEKLSDRGNKSGLFQPS